MQTMPDRISQPALRRLQLRMRPMLRPAGRYTRLAPIRHRWFAERSMLGTALSDDEIRYGVNAGILASSLLVDGVD